MRRVTDLSLLRSEHPAFVLGWNIMHVIDEASPLNGETVESLERAAAVLILSVSGTDETTGAVLMARAEYPSSAIRWNATFRDILEQSPEGVLTVDYRKFHDVEPLAPADVSPQGPS